MNHWKSSCCFFNAVVFLPMLFFYLWIICCFSKAVVFLPCCFFTDTPLSVGTFVSTALIFGLKWKIRPFLEMAFRARSAGQISFLIGGRFWRFLVIFWLFSLNCAPQCCSKGGFQYNFRRPIRCWAQLDTRTPSRGPKLGSFGIFGAFCYILAAFLLISANID